jgi:hypothetical protein
MAAIFEIPGRFRHGIRLKPVDALALTLYRLSFPGRLKDGIPTFNRDTGWQSTVFNDVCVHLLKKYESKLFWDEKFSTPRRLELYCDRVKANGEPTGKIWGFIDGSHRRVCRPQPETCDQEIMYSGYKHAHTTAWQGIVAPDGLFVHLSGA